MSAADRQAAFVIAGIFAAVMASIMIVDPGSLPVLIALPAMTLMAILVWGILRGNRLSTLMHLFVAVFLMQAVFRIRGYQDKDVDFQVILKIAVWATVAGVAALHAKKWLESMLTPFNLPCMLFLIWLFATALVSPNPVYTLVSAFTVFACVVFCAYIFSMFEPLEVFTTIVLAIVAFCFISIIVYFAIPEFGRYVYWLNEEKFVSGRLAGIAGSANNMALIAAFALVVIGLYAREFHRMHWSFVPLATIICGAALLMTNSRTPLAMVLVILFMTYALTWGRLHIALLLVSVGLVAASILLPVSDQILLKVVSRSGGADELTSLTGRTEIWYTVLKLIEQRPWTGFGYASSVFVLPEYANAIGFATSHAHNLALQLLLTTGWTGFILFMLTIAGVSARAILHGNRVMFAMLAFVLLNGVTESSGFTTLANICTLAFAIAVTLPSMGVQYANHSAYQRRFS
ncbi:MAG: O-antigen ligase family protein [Xanthobacteraceae bacterium]|jgi:O-antigen ligase|nr:O-antigen ligase family protein [Xanthobacteraceae bacterium]